MGVSAGPGTDALERRLAAAGQEHLLVHAATLPESDRRRFLAEVAGVAWERVRVALDRPPPPPPPVLRAPQALTLRRRLNEPGYEARLARAGDALLAEGRVATVLLAGGQGTRLGHPGPKGTFVLGPTDDRTLYAVLAERVAAAGRRAGHPAPLVVLTSRDTDLASREHFAAAGHFGIPPDLVRFVRQGDLPALDADGAALLAAPGRLALAPDGHGGAIEALEREGILAWLASLGVEVVTTLQVDNPLARPLDPAFLGWMLDRDAEAAGKAVRKRDAAERVGVYARGVDGRVRIVEYSELPAGMDDLVLGSIAVHAFRLAWLRGVVGSPGFSLPYHRASKRVSCLGADGRVHVPERENAVKLEQFLFDLLPLAARVAVLEVDRAREFAPVKNARGEDSPETARAAVEREIRRWRTEAGLEDVAGPLALRPLEADGPADLRR